MKKRILKFIFICITVFGILSITFAVIFDKSFSYQLEVYSAREVVNTFNEKINKVIIEEIDKSGLIHENFVSMEKSDDGKIASVKADMLTVNRLKNNLDVKIAEICKCEDIFEAKIPIGNLVGGGYLYGKGFLITVKYRPIGEASSSMSGELSEAGINQTKYRISFDVNVKAAIVFPFRYIEVPIRIQTVIYETVIVGDVPESFTYFYTDGNVSNDELQGFVEDFKA